MEHRSDPLEPVTLDDLERERLRTYIDWADVRAPVWYWPAFAAAITAWLVGNGSGRLWGVAGALTVVVVAGLGVRVNARRGQVSMPRFRGMPAPLKRAYLPAAAGGLLLVGALCYVVLSGEAPHLLLAAATGAGVALGGAWTSRRYRSAAAQVAAEVGITR